MEHGDGKPNHEGWSQIRSALQLAEHTVVHGILQSYQMPVVMNMMGAICTIETSLTSLRFPMMVKRNNQQHRYINQQQQPGNSDSLMRYPLHLTIFIFCNYLQSSDFSVCKVNHFFLKCCNSQLFLYFCNKIFKIGVPDSRGMLYYEQSRIIKTRK